MQTYIRTYIHRGILPLEGVKVLDMTRVLAGPYCSMVLADAGADVFKIEKPQTGDETRGVLPRKAICR